MTASRGALALASGLVLPGGGCGQDFVIGVLDGDGSGSATSSTSATAGTVGTVSTGTVGTGETTGSSTSVGLDDTMSGTTGGSGLDSSGEVSTGDVPPLMECGPPGHSVCDTDADPFHTIGLGCPGGDQDTQPILDPQLVSADSSAWRIVREYGNASWDASEGSNLLVLSTGTLPTPDGSGHLELPLGQTDAPMGGNLNPDGVDLPAPMSPASGSAGGAGGEPFMGCDGLGDCSETLPDAWLTGGPAHDLMWMAFDIDVPPDALGYQAELAWFSAEYPARAGTSGTDVVVWWQSSEAFTGNVATLEGAGLSAHDMAPWLDAQGLLGADPALVGTGYEGTTGMACAHPGGLYPDCPRGAGTGWLTLTAPSEPGERMTIVVAVFDLADANRDTTLLVDDWRWFCPGCEPGVDCGLAP